VSQEFHRIVFSNLSVDCYRSVFPERLTVDCLETVGCHRVVFSDTVDPLGQ
jgi:hypothetical protein